MGHLAAKSAHLALQQRLERMPVGAPMHRALMELLEELFTAEECRVAAAIPLRLAKLGPIARAAKMPPARTRTVLERLAGKGLVFDLPRDGKETLYYLNPAIIGFFEFTMMRVRDDVDQAKAARLMWEYLREDPELAFLRMLGEGETFIARPLVDEEALDAHTEILDWQRATAIVEGAGEWAEGICHCRHVKLHMGTRCDYPLEHCLSLGFSARYLVRNGLSKSISKQRALDVISHAREHGCVQMADNVRHNPAFICNCCGCCCEMLEGFRTLPQMTSVITSGWMADCDAEACTGCGKCAKACPVDAIGLVPAEPTPRAPRRKSRAVVDPQLCLGCGVCHRACAFGSLEMVSGEKVLRTPEDLYEKMVRQAVERGALPDLLFNDPSRLTHRTLAATLRAVLSLPPAAQLLARDQLRSRFVDALVTAVRGQRASSL